MFGKNIPVKPELTYDGTIGVVEVFRTIQGEGPFSGTPATFVRLQGCTLRCKFCDTAFDDGVRWAVSALINHVCLITPTNGLVVVTGGEPMLHAGLGALCYGLITAGLPVQIETSGSVFNTDFMHVVNLVGTPARSDYFSIVVSPKTSKLDKKFSPSFVSAYKYVIKAGEVDPDDGLPNVSPQTGKALKVARPLSRDTPVFVMPCDEYDVNRNEANVKAAIDSAMRFGYRLCLQIHKICRLP